MLAITNRKVRNVTLFIVGIILIVSFSLVLKGSTARLDALLQDRFFDIRGPVAAGKDIVIVSLDSDSARRLGKKSSAWKRSDFARMIRALTDAGADLVAIDYIFAVPDADPAEDQALESAMKDSANVILASQVVGPPYARFQQQEVGEGFIDLLVDPDRTVRRMRSPIDVIDANGKITSLRVPFPVAIALARLYPAGDFQADLSHPGRFLFGKLSIPWAGDNREDGVYINFAGPSGHFPTIPAYRVMTLGFDPAQVNKKVVLIGNMNQLEHDYYPVGMSAPAGRMQNMYGVEIHANAIHTLLNGRFLRPVSKGMMALLLAIAAMLSVWLAVGSKRNIFVISGAFVLLLLLLIAGGYAAFRGGYVLPGVPIYLCVALIGMSGLIGRQAEESAQKRYIMQLFGRYVSPAVVQELIRHQDMVQLNGRKERLTVFFSDIRGFTSMSEKLQPEEVSALLNDYFSRMTRIVFKHQGTLDKFMGDAIMAFFGNPIYFPGHAKEAVAMALEMKEEMQKLLEERAAAGKQHSFGIGMGINTGDVVVGNLGSAEFFDYTVIGDNVNLACRLEAVAGKGQILISAPTYEEVKGDFECNPLPPVTVKGKSQPVEVYEVIGPKSAIRNPQSEIS